MWAMWPLPWPLLYWHPLLEVHEDHKMHLWSPIFSLAWGLPWDPDSTLSWGYFTCHESRQDRQTDGLQLLAIRTVGTAPASCPFFHPSMTITRGHCQEPYSQSIHASPFEGGAPATRAPGVASHSPTVPLQDPPPAPLQDPGPPTETLPSSANRDPNPGPQEGGRVSASNAVLDLVWGIHSKFEHPTPLIHHNFACSSAKGLKPAQWRLL